MIPLPRFGRLADRQYVIGETYRLDVSEERSRETHGHYFACVGEAWANMPEIHAGRWATPEHLRKWALIRAGFRTETQFIAKSKAEAIRLGFALKTLDDYAVVDVNGCVVTHAVAKSQSLKAMNSREFQESKSAVLDVISGLIGVDAADLKREAGKAA